MDLAQSEPCCCFRSQQVPRVIGGPLEVVQQDSFEAFVAAVEVVVVVVVAAVVGEMIPVGRPEGGIQLTAAAVVTEAVVAVDEAVAAVAGVVAAAAVAGVVAAAAAVAGVVAVVAACPATARKPR